jgi:predicted dehydrogenase
MKTFATIHVGLGNRGADILKWMLSLPEPMFFPEALVDPSPEALAAVAKAAEIPPPRCFENLASALAAQEAPVAVICSPAKVHYQQVMEALRAGRHVWVEKPVTYDLRQAQEIAREARKRNLVVVVGNQYRHNPAERWVRACVRSQTYGRLAFFSYEHYRHRPDPLLARGAYPALWEQGVHGLDSILSVMGKLPERVMALHTKPAWSQYNGPTFSSVQMKFGEVLVHYAVSFDSPTRRRLWRLDFEYATVEVDEDVRVLRPEGKIEKITVSSHPRGLNEEQQTLVEFYQQITQGIEAETSIHKNLMTIALVDAAIRSFETGCAISPAIEEK